MVKVVSKNNLSKIPKTSGVYFFYKKSNKSLHPKPYNLHPIYIGKAANLKVRVKNHFQQPSYRDNLFIKQVKKIGFTKTKSEVEALLLESQLIKKYQPKYNVMWKDDKSYLSVVIAYNKEKLPYIFLAHSKKFLHPKPYALHPKTIGPFTDGGAIKKTLKFLRRSFPYYAQPKHPNRKCSWCHIDLCPGPNPNVADYKKSIKRLTMVLRGKGRAVLKNLKKEMKQLAKNEDFERAARLRDQIFSLEKIFSHAALLSNPALEKPKDAMTEGGISLLENILGLPKPVKRIECYDISNIQGKYAVGSMVVFINGKPAKEFYRKFRIRMKNEPNDIAMLKEVLERRLLKTEWEYPAVMLIDGGKAQLNIAIKSKTTLQPKTTFSNSRELENVVLKVKGSKQYKKSAMQIKVISVAKGKRELFIEGKAKPIPLKDLPQPVYNLIVSLDNEAHRFAITYHKQVRKKALLVK